MSLDIRLPQITGQTEREQLIQIKSYLYQLAPQLQWALEDINKRQETFTSSDPQRGIAQSLVGSGTSNASPQDTFASIKAFIIKSADIVNAYYEEISKRLEGEYEAVSDYGTFKQNTEQTISANSTSITNAFSNIQTISDDINTKYDGIVKGIESDINEVKGTANDANTSIVEIKANIKTGLLDTVDGTDIYGIEVGQRNTVNGEETFNKYARFTANRLSFYDKSGIEVAYISDNKLYITHAEITSTLKLGGYLVDTTNGLTFKWVGRG
jgi:hypothetical protein